MRYFELLALFNLIKFLRIMAKIMAKIFIRFKMVVIMIGRLRATEQQNFEFFLFFLSVKQNCSIIKIVSAEGKPSFMTWGLLGSRHASESRPHPGRGVQESYWINFTSSMIIYHL